ncbi:hypothetical protein HMPREF1982_03278 [Clostridiales bacterium oral taxon 876 str. F0540]|nr:hypothetical protein HMPREF1982_03278 [Clostridiales bacterium oral taxon 876 str. F0540]
MQNLNFLPDSIKEKRVLKSIRVYKASLAFIWCLCLVLFLSFIYLKQINDKYKKTTSPELIKFQESNEISSKKSLTFLTLDNFIKNMNEAVNYDSCLINNNEISLEFEVDSIRDYYNVIKDIENMNKYNIIKITPPNNTLKKFKFHLTLEVR